MADNIDERAAQILAEAQQRQNDAKIEMLLARLAEAVAVDNDARAALLAREIAKLGG